MVAASRKFLGLRFRINLLLLVYYNGTFYIAPKRLLTYVITLMRTECGCHFLFGTS